MIRTSFYYVHKVSLNLCSASLLNYYHLSSEGNPKTSKVKEPSMFIFCLTKLPRHRATVSLGFTDRIASVETKKHREGKGKILERDETGADFERVRRGPSTSKKRPRGRDLARFLLSKRRALSEKESPGMRNKRGVCQEPETG